MAIPEVGYHYSFTVTAANADPQTRTSRGWRLASDNYTVGGSANGDFAHGGYSLHGDWFNAWHPEVLQAVIAGCLQQRKDCRNGQLGSPHQDGTNYLLGGAERPIWPAYPPLVNMDRAGMPPSMDM